MTALAPISPDAQDLPSLIDRAASMLSGAKTAAEVLEARDVAGLAYDVAKRAARLQRAERAHDDLVAAAHRAQAHALEIEARAKRRLAVDTIRPRTWRECRDFAVFIGGANPALRKDQSYSEDHYQAVCQKYGDPRALEKYDTVFIDSITVAGRLCFQWCKGKPEAHSDKTGKPDVRGAYGLHGREMIAWLTHLQHTRAKNVIFVGILDEKLDDFNRKVFVPQIDGSKTGLELPGIVDEVLTLTSMPDDKGVPQRVFVCHTLNKWG